MRYGIIARMRRAGSKLTRIYSSQALAPGAIIALRDAAGRHLTQVLRATAGDRVIVFNDGVEFAGEIISLDKRGVSVELATGGAVDRESPLPCVLAQAISSGERMDLTLQKATELGVAAIQPLFSERSVVRLDPERAAKRVEHWQEVVIAACEQCGRNKVPAVAAPQPVLEWLNGLPAPADDLRVLMSPHSDQRLADIAQPARILLMTGPEGGFTDVENEFAAKHGFVSLRLGPRVLRTETAALAALAAFNTRWGDF